MSHTQLPTYTTPPALLIKLSCINKVFIHSCVFVSVCLSACLCLCLYAYLCAADYLTTKLRAFVVAGVLCQTVCTCGRAHHPAIAREHPSERRLVGTWLGQRAHVATVQGILTAGLQQALTVASLSLNFWSKQVKSDHLAMNLNFRVCVWCI